MRLRVQFLGSVVALALVGAAASVVGVHYVRKIARSSQAIAGDDLPSLVALLKAQEGLGAVRFITARAVVDLLAGDGKHTASLWEARERQLRTAEEGLAVAGRYAMTAEERVLWDQIQPAFSEFVAENGRVWTAIRAGDRSDAARFQDDITAKLPDRFLRSFDEFVQLHVVLSRKVAAAASSSSRQATRILEGILVIAIAGAVGSGVVVGRAHAERAASEERLRLFVDSAPAAIAMLDRDMRYLAVSRRWLTDYGLGDGNVIGRSHYEVLPDLPERWKVVHQRCLRGEVETCDRDSFRRADGAVEWVRWEMHPWHAASGKIGGLLVSSERITERVRLEAQLAVASRLAAVGTLVAGVAHEINNPLAAEMSGQGMALEAAREARRKLREKLPLDPEASARRLDEVIEALEDAQEGGRRISRIVKDMATFARPDPRRTTVRLVDVVEDAMRWLAPSVAQSATIEVEDRGAPDVLASAGQIEQVVVNLATNAAKATPAGKMGRIVIRIGTSASGWARLDVVDDGVGIAPALHDRIFDPFFTTRPAGEGRGSGLGLAICHAIATSLGGTLTVESEVGRGSTFRLELPAAGTAAATVG